LGRESLELVHPEDRERVRENAVAMLKGKHLPPYELRYIVKGGDILWATETVTSINYNGKRAVLGNFIDITEHKQAEEALRHSEELLRKMFESVTDGILVIDLNGVITEANQRAVEIHGFNSKEELVGRKAFELVSSRDHERIATNMNKAVKQGKVGSTEYTLLRANGTEFPAELSTSVLKNASIHPVGHITIVRDITERKVMQEQLMLTDRLASIGELASGIAHELNNPLTSIIGFSQLLMEKDIAEDFKEDLQLVHSEAQRAAGIVKNLLTFARKHAPVKQLTQINSVIEDVLKLRAYEQKVNNIEVVRQFASALPEIMVDHFLIRQVFLNLIINAEYFMAAEHNKGTITITSKRVDNTLRVLFADDGPGISRENLSRIFNPFFTTKEVGKGTGLGLSICHGIVAEHGGKMYARSQPGKGATFIVELPTSGP
jgi:two-component system NtrC family sensor kinase